MRKKMAGMLAGFLILMLTFTLLSRAADAVTIARVSVQKAQQGRIVHRVTGGGTVVPNREQAVSVLAGQTVKTICVEEGQQVSAGDLLFCVDTESLQEQILEKKRELKIADLQAKDRKTGIEAQAQKEEIVRNRAAEDYNVAAGKGNTAVSRAWQELQAAREKRELLEKDGGGQTGGQDAVLAVLEEACRQKQAEYEQALAHREELEKWIEEAVASAVGDPSRETAERVDTERAVHFLAQESESPATELPAKEQPETEAPAKEQSETEVPVEEQPETEVPVEEQPETVTPAEEQPETEAPAADQPADQELILGDETEAAANPYLTEQRIRLENQPLLDEADRLILAKKQEKEEADAALDEYLQKAGSGAQTDAQEELRAQLEQEIRAKEQAYEDARTAAGDSLRAAGRALEDAGVPKGSDSTVEIDALTREQQELQIQKLETLFQKNGEVTSPVDGVVREIHLTTGDRTPDGTAVLLSDKTSGNKLVVQVPEAQSRYIARGDEAAVLAQGEEALAGLTVDSVRADDGDPDLLDVTVQLPADTLEAGVYATVQTERRSKLYNCCVPLQALNEENGKYFVYIITESSTVLGTELTAQRRDVTVLDKNETLAALEEPLGEEQVIVSSDKMISQGSRVRPVE